MKWQIKLQHRRTLAVDDGVLRQFTDEDIGTVGSGSDFRQMIDEINSELSEEVKNEKMLLICCENDEHFVSTYVGDKDCG